MEKLIIEETPDTPKVNFNPILGELLIEGRAIPQFADEFWAPILKWIYAYSFSPSTKTRLILRMEYFNNPSKKQILFLLHKLDELYEKGYEVSVEWKYDQNDIEMKESGYDFSCVVNVPFIFTEVELEAA